MPDSMKVLLVEDDEGIRFGTEMRLKLNGYTVTTAVDGRDGLDKVADCHPDVILMDIRMPGLDGLGALKQLKSNVATAAIPVIIASASPGDQTSALDLGANYFLRKPYANETLLDMIASVLSLPLSANHCLTPEENNAQAKCIAN